MNNKNRLGQLAKNHTYLSCSDYFVDKKVKHKCICCLNLFNTFEYSILIPGGLKKTARTPMTKILPMPLSSGHHFGYLIIVCLVTNIAL